MVLILIAGYAQRKSKQKILYYQHALQLLIQSLSKDMNKPLVLYIGYYVKIVTCLTQKNDMSMYYNQ